MDGGPEIFKLHRADRDFNDPSEIKNECSAPSAKKAQDENIPILLLIALPVHVHGPVYSIHNHETREFRFVFSIEADNDLPKPKRIPA